MATDAAKDYLGHTCQTTEAFEKFRGYVEAAEKTAARDQREVVRCIGRKLLDLQARVDHFGNLMTACKDLTADDPVGDPLMAVLEVGEQYGMDCSNRFGELAGLVLKALELGHLFERRSSECAESEALPGRTHTEPVAAKRNEAAPARGSEASVRPVTKVSRPAAREADPALA